ncbi:MAG: MATE family efflux transporter [Spiroplasma sp.]|nr:MATE family efflux transporter [Spiroplasma sp.]
MATMLTEREKRLRYGKPWKTIAYFCIPTVLIMVIQGFYNVIDKTLALQFAAGDLSTDPWYLAEYNKIVGGAATSIPLDIMKGYINIATQYATQTYNLVFAFAAMAGMGCAMNFSFAFGKRDIKKMHELTGNGFSFTILFSILIGFLVFCLIFPGFNSVLITSQMGNRYNAITNYLAWEYSYPMLAATPLMFVSFYFTSLLRNEGRVNWVIIIMISSLLINCAAAVFFMKVCHLKMQGAMLGTVFSWLVQIIWGFIIVFRFKSSYSRFGWHDVLYLKWNNIWNFLKAGFPNFISGVSFVVISYLSTMLVVQLPNQPETGTGVSLLQELMSSISPWTALIYSAGIGISQGSRAILAYNYSAEKYHRIWEILKRSSILFFAWFIFILIILIAFADKMMLAFAFPKEYVQQYRWWLVLAFSSYPLASITLIAFTLYQGINKSMLASIANSLRAFTVALPMMGLGFLVANLSGNPIFYFLFFGLIDLACSLVLIPMLIYSWYKYKDKLVDVPDHFDKKAVSTTKVKKQKLFKRMPHF